MPRREKFSEKSNLAFSSRIHTWDGVGSEGKEEDALERKGFRDGVDLRLGAIEQTNARERERERESKKHQQHNIEEYKKLKVCMHENAWTPDMQT